MVPTQNGTYRTPRTYSGTGGAITSTPGTALNAWVGITSAGTAVGYVGTTTKLYSLTGRTATGTDRSKGGGYTNTAVHWCFEQFGNYTLATNGVDAIQVRDATGSSAFADLGGTPPGTAKFLVTQANAVLAFNLDSGGNMWAASDIGDHANWTTGESVADTPISQRAGAITAAVAFGDEVIVFKASSIYRMRYVGSPVYWTVDLIADGIGAMWQGSVCNCGDALVFNGLAGTYIFDGATFRKADSLGFRGPLSSGAASTAPTFRAALWMPSEKNVWFWRAEASSGDPTIYVYSLISDSWGLTGAYRGGQSSVQIVAPKPFDGSVDARWAFWGVPDENSIVAISHDGTIYSSSLDWGTAGANALVAGLFGSPGDQDIYVSRITPLLCGSEGAAPTSATALTCEIRGYNSERQRGGTGLLLTITSATDQCRFDVGKEAKFIEAQIYSSTSKFEIEDVLVDSRPGGMS